VFRGQLRRLFVTPGIIDGVPPEIDAPQHEVTEAEKHAHDHGDAQEANASRKPDAACRKYEYGIHGIFQDNPKSHCRYQRCQAKSQGQTILYEQHGRRSANGHHDQGADEVSTEAGAEIDCLVRPADRDHDQYRPAQVPDEEQTDACNPLRRLMSAGG